LQPAQANRQVSTHGHTTLRGHIAQWAGQERERPPLRRSLGPPTAQPRQVPATLPCGSGPRGAAGAAATENATSTCPKPVGWGGFGGGGGRKEGWVLLPKKDQRREVPVVQVILLFVGPTVEQVIEALP